MKEFEEVGRMLDRELTKLRQFLEEEVKPASQRSLADALHTAAQRLEELARRLESSLAENTPSGKGE